MPKVPKIRSLHIFAITPEKPWECEVDILPACKPRRFLQVDRLPSVCVARHAQSTQNNKLITN